MFRLPMVRGKRRARNDALRPVFAHWHTGHGAGHTGDRARNGDGHMKTLGMIGGMSWESTLPYYRVVNETVRAQLGGLHSARLVLYSVDFDDIERLQRAGDWSAAGDAMADAARALHAAGADLLILCTNTMHKVAGAIEAATPLPLLHIADATADAIRAAGLARVGLLGTRFTMEQDFYQARLRAHGIETQVPGAIDRDEVHRIIYEELCMGQVREASRQRFRDIMARLVESGAEGIILGCTEIMLLVQPGDTGVPTFDTTTLHARAAALQCIAGP
jgi:aspartate racemase